MRHTIFLILLASFYEAMAAHASVTAIESAIPTWIRPAADPRSITKADYLDALRPYLPNFERTYNDATKPSRYAYEALPIFVAFWRATNDSKYAELALRATRQYCLALEEDLKTELAEMAKSAQGRARANAYLSQIHAYLAIAIIELAGTPQQTEMMALLGQALGARAVALPLYWERGAHNRTIGVALWYELALRYNPNIQGAQQLRAYTESVWNDWWALRDIEEDDSGYSPGDLLMLHAWSRVRGLSWWTDASAANLWRHYAEQIGNDGTWPAYGDGANHGEYFRALHLAEVAASRLREPRYKWLAHRAFWNGRARLPELTAGIGLEKVVYLALAYLEADDSVKEKPVSPGVLVTKRRFRERTNWNGRREDSLLFRLGDNYTPSKIVFRGGSAETDAFLLLQAGSAAGHGHSDTGNVIYYGSDLAYHLSHGVTRLDHDMEQHNMFALRVPGSQQAWRGGELAVEGTAVPVSGATRDSSYARLRIAEFPGSTVTADQWKSLLAWNGRGYPPEKALGYRNWPLRLERSVLFVNGQFAVIRDVASFTIAAPAQMGQNWVIGDVRAAGPNWASVRTPLLFGYTYSDPPKAPVRTAEGALLVWFLPHVDGRLDILEGPQKSTAYGDYYVNLRRRVWYPRTGDWQPGSGHAFTTVLVPHQPSQDPAALAASVETIRDSKNVTILDVTSGPVRRVILLNSSGAAVRERGVETDAEAAMITYNGDKATHFSGWNATFATINDVVIARSTKPTTLDTAVNVSGRPRSSAR
jgi:hypothetical protein